MSLKLIHWSITPAALEDAKHGRIGGVAATTAAAVTVTCDVAPPPPPQTHTHTPFRRLLGIKLPTAPRGSISGGGIFLLGGGGFM